MTSALALDLVKPVSGNTLLSQDLADISTRLFHRRSRRLLIIINIHNSLFSIQLWCCALSVHAHCHRCYDLPYSPRESLPSVA